MACIIIVVQWLRHKIGIEQTSPKNEPANERMYERTTTSTLSLIDYLPLQYSLKKETILFSAEPFSACLAFVQSSNRSAMNTFGIESGDHG